MKASKYSNVKKYVCIRIKDDTKINRSLIKEKFGYDTTIVSDDGILIGFNTVKIEQLISDILTNSQFDLVSVSEDEKSITYHFVK